MMPRGKTRMGPTLFALILVLQVATAPSLHADSMVFEVTPQNIAKQSLQLRVETEANAHDVIRFDVFVAAGRDQISPRRAGRLEIAHQSIAGSQPGEGTALPWPMIWCSVSEKAEADALHYTFGIARQMLPQASFQFLNYEPHGMPSMDAFRFMLADFAPAR
jgi:hypothetical protein